MLYKKLASTAIALSCALGLSLSLAACQSGQASAPEASKQAVAESKNQPAAKPAESNHADKPAAAAQAGFDAGTREEALKLFGLTEAPKAVIPVSWTDATYLLAAGAPIAGLPDNHHLPEETLKKYTPITDHDGKFDFNALKQAKPDLVFANEKTLEKQTELQAFLKENGIAHQAFPTVKSVPEIWKLVAQTGMAMGTEKEMQKNLDALLKRFKAAKDSIKDVKNRKVAVLNVTAEGRSLFKGEGLVSSVLQELGLENVANSLKTTGEPDASGLVPAPSMKELADQGTGAIVILLRIKGDKDARSAAQSALEKEITEAFGADSEMVKNHKFDVADHHGLIIAIPNIISGIETVAEIVSR